MISGFMGHQTLYSKGIGRKSTVESAHERPKDRNNE